MVNDFPMENYGIAQHLARGSLWSLIPPSCLSSGSHVHSEDLATYIEICTHDSGY
jgi:hypothetical protein